MNRLRINVPTYYRVCELSKMTGNILMWPCTSRAEAKRMYVMGPKWIESVGKEATWTSKK